LPQLVHVPRGGSGTLGDAGKRLWPRADELISRGGFCHASVCDERGQSLTDVGGAHAHDIADLFFAERLFHLGEGFFDAFPAGRLDAGGRRLLSDDLQNRRILD